MPSWTRPASITEIGLVAWLRDRWTDAPIRPDRSATLVGEQGGRLDRLDLWFLVVLILGSMTLRMFRLDEPYQMHFDEVYHARTATEFLQDWRYGQSHDIYEWTHPHLAKYLMAAGHRAVGRGPRGGHERARGARPRRAVEPRREDAAAPGDRAGERLHVATGSEVRTYDLRSRALISTIAAPGVSALAMDPGGTRLVVGFDDGRIGTIDLDEIGPDAAAAGVTPLELAHVAGPVDRLFVTDDGNTIVAGQGDHLDVIDAVDGSLVGGLDLHGVADLADGGTGDALEATLADVTDPSAEASTLADLLDGDAASFEAKLRSSGDSVVLGGPGTGETRTSVETAISRWTTGRDRRSRRSRASPWRPPTGSRSSTRRARP